MFAEEKSLVHTGLKLDCHEHNFNTTVKTVLQEGIYAINVSRKKLVTIKVPYDICRKERKRHDVEVYCPRDNPLGLSVPST